MSILEPYCSSYFWSRGAHLYTESSASFLDFIESSALFPVSAASSALLPDLFPVLLFSIDVLVFVAILCWVYCSPASVGVFAAVIPVSFIALFWHLLSAISGASHWHLLVALDHGILELTLSLLLLLCRISSSSSRFICVYTPS